MNRLHRRRDFSRVLRSGRRVSRGRLVIHACATGSSGQGSAPARAGLVVSKAVGNAVVRHAVSRKLRHQLAARLCALPPGTELVVRALPGIDALDSHRLGADLDAALGRCVAGRSRQ